MSYTLLFFVVVLAVYFPFLREGKSFVWAKEAFWDNDGLTQHYTTYAYFGQYIRTIIKGLVFEHRFSLPEWSFSLGQGAPILPVLHYYGFGDPLNLTSIFIPTKYAEYGYSLTMLLRTYLTGVSFCALGRFWKKNNMGIMAGAYAYMFCYFGIYYGVKHPMFCQSMLLFPLLMLGVEWIYKKRSGVLFTVAVALTICTNVIYCRVLIPGIILYTILRYYMLEEKKFKPFLCKMGFFVLYGLLGTLMAAFIWVPVLVQYISSGRIGQEILQPSLYDGAYYQRMLVNFLAVGSPGRATMLGISAVALLAILKLFLDKQNACGRLLRLMFIGVTLALLFPIFGKMIQGTAYVSNRWCWIYALLISVIVIQIWPNLENAISQKNRKHLAIVLCLYIGSALLFINRWNKNTIMVICVLVLAAVVLFSRRLQGYKGILFLALIFVQITANAYYCFSAGNGNFASQYVNRGKAYGMRTSSAAAALGKALDGTDTFARYEAEDYNVRELNADLLTKTTGVGMFWSLMSNDYPNFLIENGHSEIKSRTMLYGNDSRTLLNALASTKYYVAGAESETKRVPYGYVCVEDKIKAGKNTYSIYENEYALPIGYTYEAVITREAYDKLPAYEKAGAMLQGIVLEEYSALGNHALNKLMPKQVAYDIPYTVSYGEQVTGIDTNTFFVREKNGQITLSFEPQKNAEIYLYAKGLQAYYTDEAGNKEKLSFSHSVYNLKVECDRHLGALYHTTDRADYYTGQEEYVVNLGYQTEDIQEMTITFPERGIYSFDRLQVIAQPMEQYVTYTDNLRQDTLENVQIGEDTLSGTITLKAPKILCLAIPYDKGWSAKVDGKEAELMKANTMYMALPLDAGEHEIELEFHTCGLKAGMIISLVGLGILIVMLLKNKPKRILVE